MKTNLLVENDGKGIEIKRVFEVELKLRSTFCRVEPNHGGSGHGITEEHGGSSARNMNGLAASVGASDQATFRGGHWNSVLLSVEKQGTRDADRDLHEPNRHLTALP